MIVSRLFWVCLWVLAVIQCDGADAEAVRRAFDREDYKGADRLATAYLEDNASDIQVLEIRAAARDELGAYTKAISDYDRLIKMVPEPAAYRQRRGSLRFRIGQIEASIKDFDAFLKAYPTRTPHHWQRGISYYYAGRYQEGVRQFETHRAVNPRDVENALWHFMCVAKSDGVKEARGRLIPVQGDSRLPMQALHKLFAGTASIEDVERVVAASSQTRSRFYADLYLGIYCELHGQAALAKRYLAAAAKIELKEVGYMGDVARVHEKLKAADAEGLK